MFGQSHVLFLHSGANVNNTDVNKRSALHEAAQLGYYEVAKLLLDHKANPDIRETVTNNTPAELASLHKHHKVSLYNIIILAMPTPLVSSPTTVQWTL